MQHQPHLSVPPKYGKQIQCAPIANTGPILNRQQQKIIQEVTETFLYYARAVNRTMLTAVSALTTKKANPAATTM